MHSLWASLSVLTLQCNKSSSCSNTVKSTRGEWQVISKIMAVLQLALSSPKEATVETAHTHTHKLHPCSCGDLITKFHLSLPNEEKVPRTIAQIHRHRDCTSTSPFPVCSDLPLRLQAPIPTAPLPVPSLLDSPPSLFTSLILFHLLFFTVPIQLAEQQHGKPGEPRDVCQPLQLRERLLVGRAHPFTLLPAQLHLWGPVACPSHPLQHRLSWTAHLPGVLPAV